MKAFTFFLFGMTLSFAQIGFADAVGEDENQSVVLTGESWFFEDRSLKGAHRKRSYTYEYGDPTPAEQAHLEAVNRARMNPQAEADRLLSGDINEGIDPPSITTDPKQPLTFNAKLLSAARLHSEDMIANDYFDHNSLDSRTPDDRINQAGYSPWLSAENISIEVASYPLDAASTLLDFHDGFVINSDNPNRGHRINVFREDMREIGAGSASGEFNGWPHAWVLTCNYAASSENPNPFVLGVVYDDQNNDDMYTAGEGIGDVAIEAIEQGGTNTFQTATASAGGYGITLPSGNWLIRATLSDGKRAEHTISITDKNVKTDFLLSEFAEIFTCGLSGDTDGNEAVELADAVIILQIQAGTVQQVQVCLESDVNTDNSLGLEEVLFILQTVSSVM